MKRFAVTVAVAIVVMFLAVGIQTARAADVFRATLVLDGGFTTVTPVLNSKGIYRAQCDVPVCYQPTRDAGFAFAATGNCNVLGLQLLPLASAGTVYASQYPLDMAGLYTRLAFRVVDAGGVGTCQLFEVQYDSTRGPVLP